MLQGIQGHDAAHTSYAANNSASGNSFGDHGAENYPPPGSGSNPFASAPQYSQQSQSQGQQSQAYDEEDTVGV